VVFSSWWSRQQYWEVLDMEIGKKDLANIWEDME
jgi:hypothetical protein